MRGKQAGQAHLDVPGAGGQVDQQVAGIAPVGVLEELLDRPVQDEAPPHDGLVLLGQESHGEHAQKAGSDGELLGDHLAAARLDAPGHAEQTRDREAPDVGVQHAHLEAPPGEGHRQVDRDRGLPDAALARGDGQDTRGGRHRGRRRALAGLQAGPGHDRGPGRCVHLGRAHLDGSHAVHGGEAGHHVMLQLVAERTGGDGEGHLGHDGAVRRDGDRRHHAEVDHVVAQLGVDDGPEGLAQLRLLGAGHSGRAGPAALVRPGSHGPHATWVDVRASRTSNMVGSVRQGSSGVLKEASR